MDPTQQNQESDTRPDEQETVEVPENKTQWGPIVGVIIIVALIVLGGLYMWSRWSDRAPAPPDVNSDPLVQELETQSSSDKASDIEADLNATDLGNLDADFAEIENELGI